MPACFLVSPASAHCGFFAIVGLGEAGRRDSVRIARRADLPECQSGLDEQSASVRAGLGRRHERSEFGRRSQAEAEAGRASLGSRSQGGAKARWVHGFAATVGDVPLIGDLLAFDLRQINPEAPRGIDGLLGQDFFRGRIVQIDFRNKRVRLLDRADAAGSAVLPIRFQNGAMCVPVSVAGSAPRWTRLDTGCNEDLHWVTVRPSRSGRRGALVGFSRGPVAYVETIVDLAEYRVSGVQAGLHEREFFPGEAGLLGTGILSNFVMTVDAPGARLILRKN